MARGEFDLEPVEEGAEGGGEEGVRGVEERGAFGVDGPACAEEAEVEWFGGGDVVFHVVVALVAGHVEVSVLGAVDGVGLCGVSC